MPSEQRVQCPQCKGERGFDALVNRGGDCTMERVPCSTCGGEGDMDPGYPARLAAGQVLRDDRLARRESLGEAARRMGVTIMELSDREHGIVRSSN